MKKIIILGCLLLLTLEIGILEHRVSQKEALPKQEEELIRILITSDEFASAYHDQICLFADTAYTVNSQKGEKTYQAGESCSITMQDDIWQTDQKLQVQSDGGMFYFPELVRAEEQVGYKGTLEIEKTEEGLLLINELPLEQYLCGVIPSEMNASFPMEALKAQAICARTYALEQKEEKRAEKYHADLDDSTNYQVYNNRQHSKRTDQAVKQTEGLVMKKDGAYVDARYYATSCGLDFRQDLSEEAVFAAFLQNDQIKSAEREEAMYRWTTEISLKQLEEQAGWDKIDSLKIAERSDKGAVIILKVSGQKENEEAEECVEGEYQIRAFLALAKPVICLQDGSTRENWSLLPSAFFLLSPIEEQGAVCGYQILGGGYGHGEGMSQNGAKHLAEQGKNYEEILRQYFDGMEIVEK